MISLCIVRDLRFSLQDGRHVRQAREVDVERGTRAKVEGVSHVPRLPRALLEAQKVVAFLQATSMATLFLGLPRRLCCL